jgi:hypothetical protein
MGMRFRRRLWFSLTLVLAAASADATDAPLLQQVAHNWLGERNRWAFTQLVREYEGKDGKELKQERLERYDPSQRYLSRWRLISIDGRPPKPQEWADWTKRKNKKHHRGNATIADNFDFANARVAEETAQLVRYELPLRNKVEWLFPVDKVELVVTINKTGPALEEVRARISEPFRVALGLARILDIDLDLQMELPATSDPADAKPSGTARAVVTKLGGRVEYFWSDFKHVTPHPEMVDDAPAEKT